MTNMEKSILEAGGLTGYYNPDSKTHNITEKEHRIFLEFQEERKREEEKNKKKK